MGQAASKIFLKKRLTARIPYVFQTHATRDVQREPGGKDNVDDSCRGKKSGLSSCRQKKNFPFPADYPPAGKVHGGWQGRGAGRMTAAEYQDAARVKRAFNQAMNMRELSAAYGMAYSKIRRLSLQENFPMSHGVVFPKLFDKWMAGGARRSRAGASPRRSGVDKARVPAWTSDSPASWPRIGGSLPCAGSLPASPEGSGRYV